MKYISNYETYLLEADSVELKKKLREYELVHKSDCFFQVKSDDFFKEFSVKPYSSEALKMLPNVQKSLEKSIETSDVNELFAAVTKAQLVPYNYGNVFNTSFSLKNVSNLALQLQPEQQKSLNTSEKEFLLNVFSQLGRETKDMIISSMRERAEIYCVVIEALFYYVRTIDTENFYEKMNREEIVETYEKDIEKSSKEVLFSYEGPFSDVSNRNEIDEQSLTAFWICEKDTKKFVIRATVSPKELQAEDYIGGTFGLKFSLSLENEKNLEEDFNFFNTEELSSRVKIFLQKKLTKK